MKISVVIPVYGSEKILPVLYSQLKEMLLKNNYDHEIILVDDCGPGRTWPIIRELAENDDAVKGIQLMKNSGQGSATLAGLKVVTGDIIVTMDDDMQHPPEEVPKLIDALLSDPDLDVIIGAPHEKKHNASRRLGSHFINLLNSKFLGKDINLRFTGFRAIRSNVAAEITKMVTYYPALGPMLLTVTRRIKNITFNHKERMEGKSNYSFSRLLKQTLSNFIGYSMLPLRILAVIGAIGIIISICLGIYNLSRYFIVGVKTTGWTSLILVLVSISGFNFFAFAMLGEYILRISHTSSDTPPYTIRTIVDNTTNKLKQ